jgi:hypothetical protein
MNSTNVPGPVDTSSLPPYRSYRRRSIFWPLFLVMAGILFLANNLGLLSGSGWDLIARLWPVLFIVGGLDGLYRGDGIAGPIFWIAVGTLFLMGNFGYLAISSWQILLNYWPVLLIAIGIDILFGQRRAIWSQALAVVLALGLLGGIVWLASNQAPVGTALNSERISESLQNATSARAEISINAGELLLSGGAEDGQFVQGTIRIPNSQTVRQDYSIEGSQAVYNLHQEGVTVGFNTNSNLNQWDLKLNSKIPTDLKVNIGAGETQLNLSGMSLSNLEVNGAVGQVTVILPSQGGFDGKINGAVGETIIRVPRGLPVTIHTNGGITSIQADTGFQKQDQEIISSGTDGKPVTLSLSQAIGSLRVEYLP